MSRQHALGRTKESLLNRKRREAQRRERAEKAARRAGLSGEAAAREIATLQSSKNLRQPVESSVSAAFGRVVAEIREQIRGTEGRPAHNAPVDIKLVFRSLDLQSKGLIFRREQKESSVSLELATRILPDED
ncbi:hypothetical protein [Pelagicoccus albus]|uniref:Uncharacterized protein n=1 Tax=Pelagicoccus albus TaxID=415222 RepID=A0A7X1B7Y7_9BACT|nr:hypothetical protein [Pelagicoccus albus]MBC2607317.1 hypothetical protein [Pelagicoccus albus]